MGQFNPRNVSEMLLEDYLHLERTPSTDEEMSMKSKLKEILKNYMSSRLESEVDETPEFAEGVELSQTGRAGVAESETEWEVFSDEPDEIADIKNQEGIDISYKTRAVEYWRGCKRKGKRNLTSVQTKFRKVTSTSQLKSWEKYVQQGGSVTDKLTEIDSKVKARFIEAVKAGNIVHDSDIKAWAMEASSKLLPDFCASTNWINDFKSRHQISSRKITRFVRRKQVKETEQTKKLSEEFVRVVRSDIERVGAANVWNSDQSGIKLEEHSGRTLHSTGVRKVVAVVQRVNALTHSFTVQPILNANGEFLKPMLVVLPEPKGTFGPQVQKNLFEAPNLCVVPSKSGKCTSKILQDWYKNIFLPQINQDSVIILDAFGGFNKATNDYEQPSTSHDVETSGDLDIDNEDCGQFKVEVRRIPKGATGLVQPLDVYGFRPYKSLHRKICDKIVLLDENFEIAVRNNAIQLTSLVFHQICSPRFRETFKYAWYTPGYLDNHPAPFATPAEYCFPRQLASNSCERENCEKKNFLRCSWCSTTLCFQHFVLSYHMCDEYIE